MKIAVFGDSISEGIGSRKYNFCEDLSASLKESFENVEIFNFAHTGTTINYINNIPEKENVVFDVVIIGYGNVDAMLRPDTNHKPNYYQYIPNRYKQNGMLNPRPYYSERIFKKIFQHIDSFIRYNLNKILLYLQGSTTWVSLNDFKNEYERQVDGFIKNNSTVIALSTVHVKDKFFPGTNEKYIEYNNVIKKIALEKNKCKYIDLFSTLNDTEFYEDGFHPNKKGYEHIALLIGNVIKNSTEEKTL